MSKRILSPLDGRNRRSNPSPARILVKKIHAPPYCSTSLKKKHLPSARQSIFKHLSANTYLENLVKKNPFLKKASVEIHVHEEEVNQLAQTINAHASDYHTDLIILSRHGEGGWKDKVVGSLARQVIGHGHSPVLLLNARLDSEEIGSFDRIRSPRWGSKQEIQRKSDSEFCRSLKSHIAFR